MTIENLQSELSTILSRVQRPEHVVVTAGMPYANGPLHIGHLAGAHVPADIFARFQRLLIGEKNVLFVCGTDDHGSTSEIAAAKEKKPIEEFISGIHSQQSETLKNYHISLNTYTGTSHPENFEHHRELCQDFMRTLYKNGMLEKRTSEQWYDSKFEMFLPDRYVIGTCPKCGHEKAYSEECDACGSQYEPKELLKPISTLSESTPVLKPTDHLYLNMWKVVDQLREWLEGKKKTWRKNIIQEVMNNVLPSFSISNKYEEKLKELKDSLPKFKSRYAPGKKIVVQFNNLGDFESAKAVFDGESIELEVQNGWAIRSITRDVAWGIPVPTDIDPDLKGKSLYVWPESLIAPISFTKTALKQAGRDESEVNAFWKSNKTKIYQFLGQDNVFFYTLMQGAMWLGTQDEIDRLPIDNERQLTEIISSFHLQIDGKKMSKSTGNFYTGDQLLHEMNYSPDQVRYFLALLSLGEKNSNFDFEHFHERNKFLAGPMNAAFEKPISACHSKFNGKIPAGNLIGKTEKETKKIVQHYLKMMSKGDYSQALFAIENYARIINGLFAQFKPHDDRHDEQERKDALYSSFYILKNLVILLSPFAPETMEKLRVALNLNTDIYSIDNLGIALSDHQIGEQVEFFPAQDD